MSDQVYRLQYDIVAIDATGNPLQVCFHGPGRVGFDTISAAQDVMLALKAADCAMDRTLTYEIRSLMVSADWDSQIVEVEEGALSDIVFGETDPTPPKSN